MSKNFTIGQRLTLGFAILVILNVVATVVFIFTLRGIKSDVSDIAGDELPGMQLVSHMQRDALEYRILTNRHILADDDAEKAAIDRDCDAHAQEILGLIKEHEKYANSDEEMALHAKIEPALNDFRALAKQVRALSRAHKNAEALALLKGDAVKAYGVFADAIKACVELNEKSAQEKADGVKSSATRSLTTSVTLGVISFLTATVAGFLIARGIGARLSRVAGGLRDSADQVAAASRQVSGASQSLADGSSEQAASLEETSASLEEMASMTQRNAESAQQAKDVAQQTRSAAEHGAVQMNDMRTAMDAIKDSSSDIAKIIKTIDEIAFQTNILALNAAVEAARAGEAGAGFAVVAEEVRALAQRAAGAARETAGKIEDAIQRSDRGVAISAEVARALGQIVEKARQVDSHVGEIATASSEQNQGIGQVNSAVGQMDKVTQANASSAEETAAAAEELSAQAQVMHENVGELMKLIGAASQAASAANHAAPPPRRTIRPTVKPVLKPIPNGAPEHSLPVA
ncbi:MAG TPA: methyl-accepting chemotaxis protein [Candidatus Didemnitutus sp.]|nr:methyl-accepting chemotaxis protein [Candidatus Didemnitutus sp.]